MTLVATAVTLQSFTANPITPLALVGMGLLALLFVGGLLLRKRS